MNSLKALSFSTCALLASTQFGSAYFDAGFNSDKIYRQDSSGIPQFREGTASLLLQDGVFTFTDGCFFNGQSTSFGVNTMAGCNIGANAVLVDSLITSRFPPRPLPPAADPTPPGGFTFRDTQFYELVALEPATQVEPGENDRVGLTARPAGSSFPINIGPVSGLPVSVFFDLQSSRLFEYKIAAYSWFRTYNSRSAMESEIRRGTYRFKFPRRGTTNQNFEVPFELFPMVEGFKEEGVPGGFRFTNTGPFADGFSQYDARVVNRFTWAGLSTSVVASVDRTSLAFKTVSSATGPTLSTVFPPVEGLRINFASQYQDNYTLPPGFFFNGDQAVIEVQVERQSGILLGLSTRVFQLPIRFVNTFAGFAATSFPENAPTALTAANADYDGDGVTNWVEWLSGTNPTKPNAPKTLSAMSFVPASAAKSDEPSGGFWQMTVDRPTDLVTGTKVQIESSTDLKSWNLINENDPQWSVIDLAVNPQIKVISKTPGLVDKRYFRVKYVATGL